MNWITIVRHIWMPRGLFVPEAFAPLASQCLPPPLHGLLHIKQLRRHCGGRWHLTQGRTRARAQAPARVAHRGFADPDPDPALRARLVLLP